MKSTMRRTAGRFVVAALAVVVVIMWMRPHDPDVSGTGWKRGVSESSGGVVPVLVTDMSIPEGTDPLDRVVAVCYYQVQAQERSDVQPPGGSGATRRFRPWPEADAVASVAKLQERIRIGRFPQCPECEGLKSVSIVSRPGESWAVELRFEDTLRIARSVYTLHPDSVIPLEYKSESFQSAAVRIVFQNLWITAVALAIGMGTVFVTARK